MKSTRLLMLMLLTCGVCACKKENPSLAERLQNGTWRLLNVRTDYNVDGIFDETLADCEKDDVYQFTAGTEVNIQTGDLHCSANEASVITVDYSVLEQSQALLIQRPAGALPEILGRVTEITDTGFVLENMDQVSGLPIEQVVFGR